MIESGRDFDHLVSIIIPVCNKWELTRACLLSIERHTGDVPHETIVMDNGSTDATAQAVTAEFPGVRHIRDERPLGFSRANNIAVGQARGNLLLLLNNDTEVTAGWLSPLVETLLSDPGTVASGPRLLYPDGTVQHAGVIFSFFKCGYHFAARWDGSHPEVNKLREFKALTAACLCCRKSDFLAAGGFDERYRNGGEDVDLCLKWWSAGRRMVYDPRSTVIHRESQTPGRFSSSKDNVRIQMKRWRDVVPQDDIACFAQTRMPQPGVRTIPVVITEMKQPGSLQKLINKLLISSQCAMPMLCITDNPQNRHVRYLSGFGPFITVAPAADRRAVENWAAQWIDDPRLDGILVIGTPEGLNTFWDRTLACHAGRDVPVVPVILNGRGTQGVLRYAINLPADARTSPQHIFQHLRTRLPDAVTYVRHPSPECTFLPAALLRVEGASAVVTHLNGGTGVMSAVTPSLVIFHDAPIPAEPPILLSIILTPDGNDASLPQGIRTLQMRMRDIAAEVVVLDNAFPAAAAAALRAVDGIILMRCDGPVTRTAGRNKAALAVQGIWLVFADDPGILTSEAISDIRRICSESALLAGVMGRMFMYNGLPALCALTMVKRADFCAAGQFDGRYRAQFADLDLCLRLKRALGERARIVTGLLSDGAIETTAQIATADLDPNDAGHFRNQWPGALPSS